MKTSLLMLLMVSLANSEAAEQKYFMCEAKTLSELQLPFKARYAFDDKRTELLAVLDGDNLNIFDLKSLKLIETYTVSDYFVDNVSFSPDNRFILVNPKRSGLLSMLVDRKTREIKKGLPRELTWLKTNQLGLVKYANEQTEFFTVDPESLLTKKLVTPDLPNGYWDGFTSPESSLIQKDYYPTPVVRIYSLKEQRMIDEFTFEGAIKEFNLEKGFALVENQKNYSVVRLSDKQSTFIMHSDLSVSVDVVGKTLYLSESYGWFSTNEADRRPYQRSAVDLDSLSVQRLDYTGPWQTMTGLNDSYFKLQVIDSGASGNNKHDYYAIMNNKWEPLIKVNSPANGFTSLDQIGRSSLFAIVPSPNYEGGKKFEGEMGLFNMNHPDRVNYQNLGETTVDYGAYTPEEDKIIFTKRGEFEGKRGEVLRLVQINQNCQPTAFRF